MAKKKKSALRVIVPALFVLAGIGFAIAIGRNTGKTPAAAQTPTQPSPNEPSSAQADPSQPPTEPTGDAPVEPSPTEAPRAERPTAQAGTALSLEGLHAAAIGDPDKGFGFTPLGSLDETGDYRMEVRFSRYGAGISSLDLSRYFLSVRHAEHIRLQEEVDYQSDGLTPFSADFLTINGQRVLLQGLPEVQPDGTKLERLAWRELSPGEFRAEIRNKDDVPIVEVVRRFELPPDSYEFVLHQSITNLTDRPLSITYGEYGPSEIGEYSANSASSGQRKGMLGDLRRIRFGYLLNERADPSRAYVVADADLRMRTSVLGRKSSGRYEKFADLWPTAAATRRGLSLVWLAQTSRYFGIAVHSTEQGGIPVPLDAGRRVERVVLNRQNDSALPPVLGTRLITEEFSLVPGASRNLDLVVYSGPLSRRTIGAQTLSQGLNLERLVALNMGGMCGWCTFSWLTAPILGLLRLLHDYVVFDWALAIIVLVLIVRTCLHPITKWSQIRMQRFGKQMQGMAPKQKKLQEKYGHDRKLMQQEMAKLWREEGISPAGFLGCIPIFLQTPVWIAVYAVLYFAIELRQQPGFFGIFQSMTGGSWPFLADLAEPDRAIWFGGGVNIPLIGRFESINILPILLGFVYWFHQKTLSPTTEGLTPEQRQQQVMMKWMTVLLFPLLMYNQASGLALYFVANSTFAIIEGKLIKRHINKHDLLNMDKIRAARANRAPGFMARLRQAAEARQQLLQQQGRGGPKGGPRRGPNPPRKEPPNRFKQR